MLINPDESIHAQAQDNNNQNAGEDAIQHIAIFCPNQVIAKTTLGGNPLPYHGAADAVGGRYFQSGNQGDHG